MVYRIPLAVTSIKSLNLYIMMLKEIQLMISDLKFGIFFRVEELRIKGCAPDPADTKKNEFFSEEIYAAVTRHKK